MILTLKNTIAGDEIAAIEQQLADLGCKASQVKTQQGHYLVGTGGKAFDLRLFQQFENIRDVHQVSDSYQLVSSKWRVHRTVIDLGDGVKIGADDLAIMAGPCSIESEAQIDQTIAHLLKNGVKIMRGGVFKPRSSPYSFRGLGIEGLHVFHQKCREAGIKLITEVMHPGQIEEMADEVDIFQVGARNAQNFNLLEALGECGKPVMLKRGISGTIEELLQAAEYVFSSGNEQVLFCERGIRTFETATRNTLDLSAVPLLKEKSHLPVIVDPSHGVGIRRHVPALALAAVMAGADGLIIEVHDCPEKAYSDGQQTLSHLEAEALYPQLRSTFELRRSFLI